MPSLELREPIAFNEVGVGGALTPVAGWDLIRANIRDLSASEAANAGIQAGFVGREVQIPWRNGLKSKWIIVWGAKQLRITGFVDPRNTRRWWIISTESPLEDE